jgi:hypothetical protein
MPGCVPGCLAAYLCACVWGGFVVVWLESKRQGQKGQNECPDDGDDAAGLVLFLLNSTGTFNYKNHENMYKIAGYRYYGYWRTKKQKPLFLLL